MADQSTITTPTTATQTPDAAAAPPSTKAKPANAKPEPPKRGKARHDEIRQRLSKTVAGEPAGGAPAQGSSGEPADASSKASPATQSAPTATTEPEKPKPAVGAVMRLTAENTKLKTELDEVRGKLEAHGKSESLEALRARVKADPAVLFDVFGEDIDADENGRWTKLVESIRDRQDPGNAAAREVEKLKRELAERDARTEAETKKQAEERRAQARREHTAKVLTEGFKDEIGEAIVDSAKYPYVNHLTRVGEVDVHRGISEAVRDMVVEFEQAQKRMPTDPEIAKFIAIAAGQAEEHFSKRAKNWQLVQPAPTETPVERKATTTIGSGLGSRQPPQVDKSQLSKKERHEEIRARLRSRSATAPN